jgi:single-strand DNA-binding protein
MINKAILMGRLTREPELRHTNSGTAVCSFSIAINNGFGENAQTDFINCVAWNKTAEFVSKYFSKGKMIIVIGRISTRSWDGPDGKKNYATEVVANEVAFGESKRDGGDYNSAPGFGGSSAPESVPAMPAMEDGGFSPLDTDDDLPF